MPPIPSFGFLTNFSRYTGNEIDCLNLGSYNYLGFSNTSGACLEAVCQTIRDYGVSTSSTQAELGKQPSGNVLMV